jgi:hypothetical protein
MRKLSTRIEALEKIRQTAQDHRKQIIKDVMSFVGPREALFLLGAWGAERAGGPLLEEEQRVREQYLNGFTLHWRSRGHSTKLNFVDIVDPLWLIAKGVAGLTVSDHDLIRAAWDAAEAGRPATEEESAALERFKTKTQELCALGNIAHPRAEE